MHLRVWQVLLGRRNNTTNLFHVLQLISAFKKNGLDIKDLVVLSVPSFNISYECVLFRRPNCTNDEPPGINRTNLDPITPTVFDNNYSTDEVLFNTRGAPIINVGNLLASKHFSLRLLKH
ncbi:hypothetical protein Ahy_B04g069849 [Arachis hypogaea]|uniref:Uncharacterized protein n=1 Tax=Arachis hypogaea TaxID=3818 RepID=A0A444ZDR3_ARAHY|nr:hypothetical protein Ahy_B04g069849 [Arachis hypogaea]